MRAAHAQDPTCDLLELASHWIDFHGFDAFAVEANTSVKEAALHVQSAKRNMWEAQDMVDNALQEVDKNLVPFRQMVQNALSKAQETDTPEQHAARQKATGAFLANKADEANANAKLDELNKSMGRCQNDFRSALQALLDAVQQEYGRVGGAPKPTPAELDPELAKLMELEIQALTSSASQKPPDPLPAETSAPEPKEMPAAVAANSDHDKGASLDPTPVP